MGKQSRKEHRANTAKLRMVRIAPRKARIVIDLIRGEGVERALDILRFTPKKAAPIVAKLVESAISNVDHSDRLDWRTEDLVISRAWVDEGPTLKRFRPRAQGRATRINKRTSHITVVLEPRAAAATGG